MATLPPPAGQARASKGTRVEGSDRWLAILFRALLIGLFIWLVKGLLVPVALGALFALLLFPLQVRLEKRLGRLRSYAALLVTIGTILLVLLPFALILQQAIKSVNEFLASDLPATASQIQAFVTSKLGGLRRSWGVDVTRFRAGTDRLVSQIGSAIANAAGGLARALPTMIVHGFLFLVALYYFLRDGGRLSVFLFRLSPFARPETEELFASIRETVNGAILGLIATALVQGGLTLGALYALQVPGAFIFGLIATLLSFIPMVGTTPVTVGAAIYLVAVGRPTASLVMVVMVGVIGLSDNVVRPWVQSSHGHMHPLVALLAIFGGLEVIGASGIFIGPIIAAMALWIVDTYAALRNRQRQRLGLSMPPPSSRASETPPSAPSGAPPPPIP